MSPISSSSSFLLFEQRSLSEPLQGICGVLHSVGGVTTKYGVRHVKVEGLQGSTGFLVAVPHFLVFLVKFLHFHTTLLLFPVCLYPIPSAICP